MVTVDKLITQLELFNRTATIEELLEKPDVVNFLREAFESLPPKSKTIARNISSKPPASSGSKPRCTSLVAILEVGEIALPEEVQTTFNGCKVTPSKFWSSVGIQNDAICFTGSEPIDTVASQAYIGLTSLDTRRKWDTITWRYYTLFFYDLILLIGGGKTNLTAGLHRKLFEVLDNSPLITDSLDIIKNNISTWVTAGSRYSKFCKSLDDGALFLLPPLSDSIWEDAHSLCGSAYDQAVQHLIDLKICELSRKLGADALGTQIRAAAIEPFRWSVETFRLANPLHSKSDAQHSEERARKRRKKSNHTPPSKRQKRSNQTRPGQQTEHHCPAQPVRHQSTGRHSTDAANLQMLSTAASASSTTHQTSTHGQVDPCEKGTQAAHLALHYPITGQSEYRAPAEMLTMATIMASLNIPNTPHVETPASNNCNLHDPSTNAIDFNIHDLNNYAIDFNIHDLNNYAIDFNVHDLNNYAIDYDNSCDYSETPPHHSR